MIEINKLNGMSLNDIKTLLTGIGGNKFEIAFPKTTQLFSSSTEEIAQDYLLGAFAGQELAQIADDFKYLNVAPSAHASFEYTVICKELNSLADKLLLLSYYFDNGTQEDYEGLLEELSRFEGELNSIDIACPDLLQEYLNASKTEED